MKQHLKIDLGIFAHNEAANIQAMLLMLQRQDIFGLPDISLRVFVLANGCDDATVELAEQTIAGMMHAAQFEVCNIAIGGKSRTWNAFVHDIARADSNYLIFCDADIDIPQPDALRKMIAFVQSHPKIIVSSSRPVKDIVYAPERLNLRDRMIAAGGGTLDDWRKSVCGQLYILKADIARSFHLPIGLPVEDGFVRAMVLTDLFRQAENPDMIDGDESVFHVYQSERGVLALIRHQVRIVIGSALNAVVFETLHGSAAPQTMLETAARDPDWLGALCQKKLPQRYGFVPFHFLTKRLSGLSSATLKRKTIVLMGFGFDLVVYVIAQVKMARGVGAGYW
ncbi:glycosyltransferase [Loktanella sp. 5RATIMAR09]|uniref:glycosyltransferase n=1 Tax=Loktanella sp. 5RATIMAR09 TaxID=1225655 RepID=UPI0025700B17|nr:glycosyltransferase [Loktanella sp. 5RATIMAR09]